MAASLTWPIRTLTERRNDISTLESAGNPAELAPEIFSEAPGIVTLSVADEGRKRQMELHVSHVPLPEWFVPSLERCGPLLLLPRDWNRSGAPPIEASAIQNAMDALWSFMVDRSSLPQWTPTRSGGVQLDWHEKGIDLEIEFAPNATDGYAVFSDNDKREADWDGPVFRHLDKLRLLFEDQLVIQ